MHCCRQTLLRVEGLPNYPVGSYNKHVGIVCVMSWNEDQLLGEPINND